MVYKGWKFVGVFLPQITSPFEESHSSRTPHFVELCNLSSWGLFFPHKMDCRNTSSLCPPFPISSAQERRAQVTSRTFGIVYVSFTRACSALLAASPHVDYHGRLLTFLSFDYIFPLCPRWSPWVRNNRVCKIIEKNTSIECSQKTQFV